MKLRAKLELLANRIREIGYLILDPLLGWPRPAARHLPNKVLVVRLDAIGDAIVWLDAAQGVRKLYPEGRYSITLMGNRIWTPLFEDCKLFDEIWPIDRARFFKNLAYRRSVLRKVAAEGFQIAIQPTYSRECMFGDSIIRASCAEQRIGSAGNFTNQGALLKKISDSWYTRLIAAGREPVTELERNAEFVAGLGLSGFRAGIPSLPVSTASPLLLQNYYVLVPGAGAKLRQWPAENFGALADRIYRATGWTGVICGSAGEREIGDAIGETSSCPLENWAGKTSLKELVAVVAHARVVIGNESSAIHISAAVSVPAVCIVGGGHFGRFVPYPVELAACRPLPVACFQQMPCFGCNWKCDRCENEEGPAVCIRGVSVDAVWSAVKGVIGAE